MEKACQHKIEVKLLSINFQQTFNKSSKLIDTKELGVQAKLETLIMMNMKRTTTNFKMQKGEIEESEIDKDLM